MQYLNKFICGVYQQIGSIERRIINSSFHYFLIDVLHNQTMSLVEILKTKKDLKLQSQNLISFQQCIEVALQHAKTIFNTTEDYGKQTSQQQKIGRNAEAGLLQSLNKDYKDIKLIDTINFDKNLKLAEKQYLSCIQQKKNLLELLSNNHLKLEQINTQCHDLLNQREILFKNIYSLATKNYESTKLKIICLDFESQLTNQSSIFSKFFLVAPQKLMNRRINRTLDLLFQYSKDSCVAFISLLGKIGEVSKVSQNFQDIVPLMANKQAVGMNINFIMPQGIAVVHDQILNNFIQKQVIQQGLADYPLLIGVDRDGWSVPYQIKVQIILISDQELGASAWIRQYSNQELERSSFITVNMNNNNSIFVSSFKFYQALFIEVFSKQEILNIQIGNLAPTFMGIVNSGQSGEHEILIIKPKQKDDCIKSHINFQNINYQNEGSNVFCNLVKYDLYLMKAELFPVKNKFTSFVEIKINFLQHLITPSEIKDNFKLLAKQLIELCHIDSTDVLNHLNIFLRIHENCSKQQSEYSISIKQNIFEQEDNRSIQKKYEKTQSSIFYNPKKDNSIINVEEKTSIANSLQDYIHLQPQEDSTKDDLNQNQEKLCLNLPQLSPIINIPTMNSSPKEKDVLSLYQILSNDQLFTPRENFKQVNQELKSISDKKQSMFSSELRSSQNQQQDQGQQYDLENKQKERQESILPSIQSVQTFKQSTMQCQFILLNFKPKIH